MLGTATIRQYLWVVLTSYVFASASRISRVLHSFNCVQPRTFQTRFLNRAVGSHKLVPKTVSSPPMLAIILHMRRSRG